MTSLGRMVSPTFLLTEERTTRGIHLVVDCIAQGTENEFIHKPPTSCDTQERVGCLLLVVVLLNRVFL